MRKWLVGLCAMFLASSVYAQTTNVRTLVFSLRSADYDGTMAPTTAAKMWFAPTGSIATFWQGNSYGKLALVGTAHPVKLVSAKPRASFGCGTFPEAKALLAAQGVDVASYQLLVMYHTPNPGCPKGQGGQEAGVGTIRINGSGPLTQAAHEVGHAVHSLMHASSVRGTTRDEYGWYGDIMGKGDRLGSSNVVHKLHAKYIDNTRFQIHAAAQGVAVEYVIKPITSPDGIVGVRIGGGNPMFANYPMLDAATWIEYRQPVGIDATTYDGLLRLMRGAIVSVVGVPGTDAWVGCNPCLVDTTPATWDKWDSSVLPGQSFKSRGHLIETLAATPEGVTVRVTKQ